MTRLTGRIVRPGDVGWDDARKGYDQLFDIRPQAVVFREGAHDVVNAPAWARENGVAFRDRGGRHTTRSASGLG